MSRILLTTVYRKGRHYDYYKTNTRWKHLHYTWPRVISLGLRFIKQNVPEVDILEYPTWKEFVNKLEEGYDIVGFSSYINEIPEIIEMVNYARKRGVKTIWGGNYGMLTPGVAEHFDKVFIGYAEKEIAKEVGRKIDMIKHPPLVSYVGTSFGVKLCRQGSLFTSRGCTLKCKLCQTPVFCKSVTKVPIESIDQVLKYYMKLGVKQVVIEEENFGLMRGHMSQVLDLFSKYNFQWGGMMRADIAKANLEKLIKSNMSAVFIGVENLNQHNLDSVEKREMASETVELLKELKRRKLFVGVFYIIGFEDDTEESIKRDMKRLRTLGVDITQLCVLTPFPKTPLWKDLDKNYGIFDRDWHHYDTKHLVWNHPNIKAEKMREILDDSFRLAVPRHRFFQTASTWARNYYKPRNPLAWPTFLVSMVMKANLYDYKKLKFC